MTLTETPQRIKTNGFMDYSRTRKRGDKTTEDNYTTPPRRPTILSDIEMEHMARVERHYCTKPN